LNLLTRWRISSRSDAGAKLTGGWIGFDVSASACSAPQGNGQVCNPVALPDVVCERHCALDQCVKFLLQIHHTRSPPFDIALFLA